MSEKGTASLELALGVAVLVIPALVAVVSFGPWLEARAFARAAAAEGARVAVLASGDPALEGAAVVSEMARQRGFENGDVRVGLCGAPPVMPGSSRGTCVLIRGGEVVVTVIIEVPLISTPWGDVGGVDIRATHAESVDAYRSLP